MEFICKILKAFAVDPVNPGMLRRHCSCLGSDRLISHPNDSVQLSGQLSDRSLLGVNLVKLTAINKVHLARFVPTAKGLVDGEQVQFGQLFGVLGLGFG